MNAHEKIEAALRQIPWTPSPEVDDRILADGLAAFDAAHGKPSSTQPDAQRARFGGFLRGTWGRLGMAASFAGAALLALVFLNRTVPLTLADVQQAVAMQTWVHVKFDNGREEWTNLREGRTSSAKSTDRRSLPRPDRGRAAGLLAHQRPAHPEGCHRHMAYPSHAMGTGGRYAAAACASRRSRARSDGGCRRWPAVGTTGYLYCRRPRQADRHQADLGRPRHASARPRLAETPLGGPPGGEPRIHHRRL